MMLLLVGCLDPISNRLFFEDQEFLDALPSAEDDRVRYEATASVAEEQAVPGTVLEAPPGAPSLLVLTVESVNGVNLMVDALLGIVDAVRKMPPTTREEDGRTWGPFPMDDAPGFDVRMVSTRRGLGEFTWAFEVAAHGSLDWETFFSGVHLAGATVREGSGTFAFDGIAVDELHGSSETPFYLEAKYDHHEGNEVEFALWTSRSGEEPFATYAYTIDLDDAGTFTFDTSDRSFTEGDDAGGKPEHYHVNTHWVPGEGGRGDASISGGDLAKWDVTVQYTECWLPDGALLFQDDNLWFVEPPVGSEKDCTVGPASSWP
jgi:hypothetical protein